MTIKAIDDLRLWNNIPNVKITIQVLKSSDTNYATAHSVFIPENRKVDRDELVAASSGLMSLSMEMDKFIDGLDTQGFWDEHEDSEGHEH